MTIGIVRKEETPDNRTTKIPPADLEGGICYAFSMGIVPCGAKKTLLFLYSKVLYNELDEFGKKVIRQWLLEST